MVINALVLGLIKTNCYIVSNDNSEDCVVIDPGDRPQQILDYLEGNGLSPKYIFITHGHFDHVSAVPGIREKFGSPMVIHAADTIFLQDIQRPHYRGKVGVNERDILIGDGKVIELDGLSFTWLHTPGHSPGSCSILCGDALFSGDTLFYDECGRCDFEGGSYPQMLKSLKRLADLEGNPTVYPGHGPSTTLEREREHNAYMKEATGVGPPVY